MNIVETVMWRKYSIDLNTGSEIEYINMATELTAQHCVNICNSVQETFEISARLKPVAVQVTDACAAKITESFLK
jgi:hypothetical protein